MIPFNNDKGNLMSILNWLFNVKQKPQRSNFKVSAYLSIYNDWDILEETLKSVKDHVDELIVVDGAYEWMESFVSSLGWDATKSQDQVYTIINNSGIPYRSISKTWKNEVEKRIAGYAACNGDYVWRIDSDEIYFYYKDELDNFYQSGMAVAEMEMPMYLSPDYIVRDNNLSKLPCQCFIFNRAMVSPELHLNYLWLVLTLDQLPLGLQKTPFRVFEKPIAFNAHLTNFRSSQTSIVRGSFYNINWMRENGVSWSDNYRNKVLEDPNSIFDELTPEEFLDTIRCGAFTVGLYKLKQNESVIPTPLNKVQIESITSIYQKFKLSLIRQYEQNCTKKTHLISNTNNYLDLACLPRHISERGYVTIKNDALISHIRAKALITTYTTPFFFELEVATVCDSNKAIIYIPDEIKRADIISAVLEFSFGLANNVRHTKFVIC